VTDAASTGIGRAMALMIMAIMPFFLILRV
jgi:hypothetical protein